MAVDISTLGIEVKSDGVATASDRLKTLSQEGANAEQSTSKLSGTMGGLESAAKAAGAALAAFGLAEFVKSCIDASLQMERMQKLFKAAAGDANLAGRELEYVRGVADKLGLNLLSTTESYGKFLASIRNTTLEGEKGRKVFESVAAASTALGLSGESTNRIFIALQQMMSKGKVAAEELNGQLGESLPGALDMAARGMSVTRAELLKMMQDGELMADDLLPKLAAELEKTYGKAALEGANSTQAAINRMNNTMMDTKAVLGDALSPAFNGFIKVITASLKMIYEFIGGLQILAIKAAALPDKIGAWLEKPIFGSSKAYEKRMAEIKANEDGAIADLMKKFEQKDSAYTAAEKARQAQNKPSVPVDKEKKGADIMRLEKAILNARMELWNSYWKWEDAGLNAQMQRRLSMLEWEREQGLVTSKEYINGKEQMELEKADKEIERNEQRLATMKKIHAEQLANGDTGITKQSLAYLQVQKQINELLTKGRELEEQKLTIEQNADISRQKDDLKIKKDILAAETSLLSITEENEAAARKQAELNRLNNRALDEGTRALQAQADALRILKAQQADVNALRAITNKTADTHIAMADDPYEKQRMQMQKTYADEAILIQQQLDLKKAAGQQDTDRYKALLEYQLSLASKYEKDKRSLQADQSNDYWKQALDNAKKTFPKLSAFDKMLTINREKLTKYNMDGTKNEMRSNMAVTSAYTGAASAAFESLAASQDQSSRNGFETAKAFNLAAAIMSTASGVMAQLAAPDGGLPSAWARAAIVGVMGAINIAKIASTSFGGGDTSVSTVPSGSFSGGSTATGGTVGGSIGSQYVSLHDSLSQDQLQQIADSMENASLAIGKVADGLTKIESLFTDGSFLTLLGGALQTDASVKSKSSGLSISSLFSASKKDMNTMLGLDIMRDFNSFNFSRLMDDSVELIKASALNSILPGFNAIFGNIFGGSTSITGQGISLGLSGKNATAKSFVDLKKDGGWFSSDKNWTNYADNSDVQVVIQKAIGSIQETVVRAATAMGTSADLGSATLSDTKIYTDGKTADEINKELQTWLTSAASAIAKTTDGLQNFAFYGEDAWTALVRLSTALQSTNEKLELVGANLINSTLSGANAAYKLQQMMGGADDFSTALDTYFTSMFTDTEQSAAKAAQAQRQVSSGFAEINTKLKEFGYDAVSIPQTREQFRSLVNALDLTTDSGATLFSGLMNISEAFGTVMDAADEAAEKLKTISEGMQDLDVRLLKAAGNDTAADALSRQLSAVREIEQAVADNMGDAYIAKLRTVLEYENSTESATAARSEMKTSVDAAMAILTQSISTAKTAAQDQYNAIKANAQSQYDAQIAALDAQKDAYTKAYELQEKAASDYVSKISAIAGTLQSTLDSMASNTEASLLSRREAQLQIRGYVNSSSIPLNGELDDALKIVSQSAKDLFGSKEDYLRDAALTANDVSTLNGRAKGQLSTAEATLQTLKDGNTAALEWYDSQAKAAKNALNATLEAAEKQYNGQMAELDEILAQAQAQVNAINGTTVATMSVKDAVTNLGSVIASTNSTLSAALQRIADAAKAASVASKPITGTGTSGTGTGTSGSSSGSGSTSTGFTSSQISDYVNSTLAMYPNDMGAAYQAIYNAALGNNVTSAQIAAATGWSVDSILGWCDSMGLARFAKGGIANTASIFGEAGPEAAVPLPDGRHIPVKMYGDNYNAELLEEIRQLRAELKAANTANAKYNQKTSKILDKWDNDGMPAEAAA